MHLRFVNYHAIYNNTAFTFKKTVSRYIAMSTSNPNFTFLMNHIYLLTPWCRVLLKKLTGLQLVKKFPAFHGTRRFITALTNVRHLSLSWASLIQSIYPHPTSWRSILILSTHLHLGLPSGLLPSGFPTKTLYTPIYIPREREREHARVCVGGCVCVCGCVWMY